MPNDICSVLVLGATGQQGGAVARALLTRKHRVRAFTRKPASPAAQALQRLGAEVVNGSFDDPGALRRALIGMDAAFVMGTPFEEDTEAEVRHGCTIIDLAATVGIKHLVYSSVAGADGKTGIPHFESKHRIEQHLRRAQQPFTIVAPVFFMENLRGAWMLPALRQGKLSMALPAARPLQMIALADLGRYVAAILERGEPMLGRRIELASDEVTGTQAAGILSRATGKNIVYEELPLATLRAANPDFAVMYAWFNRVGFAVPIAGLKREFPDVGWRTFESWAGSQNWDVLSPSPTRKAG